MCPASLRISCCPLTLPYSSAVAPDSLHHLVLHTVPSPETIMASWPPDYAPTVSVRLRCPLSCGCVPSTHHLLILCKTAVPLPQSHQFPSLAISHLCMGVSKCHVPVIYLLLGGRLPSTWEQETPLAFQRLRAEPGSHKAC